MKKVYLLLTFLILGIVSVKAQALFYIPAGSSPQTNCSVFIFVNDNGTLKIIDHTVVSDVKQKILEDPNYYEKKAKTINKVIGSAILGYATGYQSAPLKYLRQSNGYNFYTVTYDFGIGIGRITQTDYFAFSSDWSTFVQNPTTSSQYWTRINKSNFEVSF
ncbi:MAG: hypothetical protein LIO90_01095 [Bacteroidales bacterium]|nr:hypothetical protein [Bacteroidales bacterium]